METDIQSSTSEIKTENAAKVLTEKCFVASDGNENVKLVSENSQYDSDYDSDDCYYDEMSYEDEFEIRTESAGMPRRGYGLKHGKVITNRGSNQEKFISRRCKELVKYGRCDVPATGFDIDKGTQAIIEEWCKSESFNLIKPNRTVHIVKSPVRFGERSVLIHHSTVTRHADGTEENREELLKVYRIQFGRERIQKWALNEYVNAWHIKKHVNAPYICPPMKNALIMNFIGDDGVPAPNLNEVTFEITEKLYMDVITGMHKLYNNAKRVHGKLSARTILWWRDKFYFISFSNSVETSHPNALCLLMKDCCRITHFFKSKGLRKVKSILNLFRFITGLEQPGPSVLLAMKHARRPVKHKQKNQKTF